MNINYYEKNILLITNTS